MRRREFLGILMLVPLAARANWQEKLTNFLSQDKLTDADISEGLKQALEIGSDAVVQRLGRENGFAADPAVRIPLPDTLRKVHDALDKVGFGEYTQSLEDSLNRAAEVATPKAKALFFSAIKQMTLSDARRILDGSDDAATQYFRRTTGEDLATEMRPLVAQSLEDVGAIAQYEKTIGHYKKLPFVPDVQSDITDYVVGKGMDGIFHYLAKEEAAIRKDPLKRTTDLLQKVFGQP